MREKIKLESSAGTGHFYTTTKNKRTMPDKLEIKKYDPVARKHVVYKEDEAQVRRASGTAWARKATPLNAGSNIRRARAVGDGSFRAQHCQQKSPAMRGFSFAGSGASGVAAQPVRERDQRFHAALLGALAPVLQLVHELLGAERGTLPDAREVLAHGRAWS